MTTTIMKTKKGEVSSSFKVGKYAIVPYKNRKLFVVMFPGRDEVLVRNFKIGIQAPWKNLDSNYSAKFCAKVRTRLSKHGKRYDFCQQNHSSHHWWESENKKTKTITVLCRLCGHRFTIS